jgi:hypothetical protein
MSLYELKAQAMADAVFEFQVTTCFSLLGLVLSIAVIFVSPSVAAAVLLAPG